ncbi:glycosyltransferase family 2 protein [Bacteroides mediterraneensis]|uniref:Glycosyltransferase n=1 Tax=Bacteroides mediterraneensis TaxID=1841856 RepID=A0ABS2EX03_9BACE|nr:glycosyltransferase family 2 protein [Bacteroides mediterraneensis]MBM6759073.1 glycosyltransferase [Bacteroides mediterraneensis]
MRISVITVCYNTVSTIEKTILSVINQSYKDLEYIIIDGNSKDGTVDIIKKYSENITHWISEPDKGIYDAMNKGIAIATGDYICFMNAGDTFHSNSTIMDVVQCINKNNPDIIYGDTNFIYEWGQKIQKPEPLINLNNQMVFCHLSSLVKSQLIKQQLFDTKFKISADYNFLYQQYKAQKRFEYIPICITNFDNVCGISAMNYLLAKKENAFINGNIHKLKWKLYYLQQKTFYIIKKLIPHPILLQIQRLRRK